MGEWINWSGLLGYSIDGKFSERNVELFNAYGTQWGDSIGTRNFPEGKLSIVESIGEQPLDTITKVQISIKEQMELHEGFDYIVQFYVKPNMGYFQPSYEPCYINGANITIDKKIRLIFDEKIHCVIYPTPEHKLGLISFYFFKFDVNAERENEKEDFEDIIFRVAKKHLYTIIEYLSFTHDTEIYVCNSLVITIPYGDIFLFTRKTNVAKIIDISGLPIYAQDELCKDAISLYCEAIAASTPTAKFLTLWRCYENIQHHIREFQKKHTKIYKRIEEIIPPIFAFQIHTGQKFSTTLDKMRQIRNSIAHSDTKKADPVVPYDYEKIKNIELAIPVLRYMAKVSIENYIHSKQMTTENVKK